MESNQKPTWFCPTSDVGFHKIFCVEGNDDLILQLLNAVIPDKTIVSFERLDTYHPINNKTHSTFDLYCSCDDGSRVIVECQRGDRDRNFLNRALVYSAMAILDQAKPNWRYRFDKVYFVGLLNYIAWKGRPQAITEIALYTSDDHVLTNNNYLQIFVELPKLAAEKDGEDFSRLFLRAMRDIGKSETRPVEYADKRLDTLFDASMYQHLSDEEQNIYEKEMTTIEDLRDYYEALMEERVEEAVKERLEEAVKERVKEAVKERVEERLEEAAKEASTASQREIAKKMLSDGMSIDVISKYTGLSEAEIKVQ